MKKFILLILILMCNRWVTNAQQSIDPVPGNQTALTSNEAYRHTGLFTIAGPLQFSDMNFPANETDYRKKSRNNRIASLCLAGGGLVIAGIGALTFPKDYDLIFENGNKKDNQADAATALIIIGCAAMLSSIPFTIMSSVNKRKAKLMVSNQKTGFGVPKNAGKYVSGISMAISIGK